MVLVFDDVPRDIHAQSRALPGGFGGEEGLEEALFHLVGHADPVVFDGDIELFPLAVDVYFDGRLEVYGRALRLLPYRIAGIVHDVQHGAAQILRDDGLHRDALFIRLLDGDVEVFQAGAHRMLGEPDVFLDQLADVGRDKLVLFPAGIEQDVLYDAGRAVAMFAYLLQVFLQVLHDVLDVFPIR